MTYNVSCGTLNLTSSLTHIYACIITCARLLPRRPTALTFTKCGNYVIVADKAGDVHRFSVSPDSDMSESHSFSSSLLLGHVSMLMDVVGAACHVLT